MVVTLPYSPRWYQREFHNRTSRFHVEVLHRRAGKTVEVVNDLVRSAVRCQLERPRVAYIAPLYRQAKRVAWEYVKEFTRPIPGMSYLGGELVARFPTGAEFALFGADNPDSLRGMYFDAVALDEVAQMAPRTWHEVLRPALADRQGSAIFIGTPAGRLNLFYQLFEYAMKGEDSDWSARLMTVDDTGIIPDSELNAAQRTMAPEEYAQEFFCDWSAAIRGAYYAKQMAQAERDNRIGSHPHDPSLPVITSWDFGWADLLICIHWQTSPGRVVAVGCDAFRHTAIPDAIAQMKREREGWNWTEHWVPHDARKHDETSGFSREEVSAQHGWRMTMAPRVSLVAGIDATRLLLPRVWFNAEDEGVRRLVEALRLYRSEPDDVRGVQSATPVHDWTSHYADAARAFATTESNRYSQFDMWNESPDDLWALEKQYARAAQ